MELNPFGFMTGCPLFDSSTTAGRLVLQRGEDLYGELKESEENKENIQKGIEEAKVFWDKSLPVTRLTKEPASQITEEYLSALFGELLEAAADDWSEYQQKKSTNNCIIS